MTFATKELVGLLKMGPPLAFGMIIRLVKALIIELSTLLKVWDTRDPNGNWLLDNISFIPPNCLLETIKATPKPFHSRQMECLFWHPSPNGHFTHHPPWILTRSSFGKSPLFTKSTPSFGFLVMIVSPQIDLLKKRKSSQTIHAHYAIPPQNHLYTYPKGLPPFG